MQQFESLVQSIDGIIIELDPRTFVVTFVNRAVERILGYPPEHWLDDPTFWISILHPEDRVWATAAKKELAARGGEGKFEYRMIAADARVVWLRDLMALRYLDDGAPRLCGVMIDITDSKRAEEELKRQKEILQKIFDHIPVMISFFDERGQLKLANREWERVLGLTLAEVRERGVDVIAESYPDPRERQRAFDLIAEPNGKWEDFTTQVSGGCVIETSWAAVQLSDGTRITIGRDVTERKLTEGQLRANAERLRALSARLQSVREDEAARIAREIHDELGGALTGLKMDVAWVKRRLADSKTEVAQQKLDSMSELIDETIQKVRTISTELRPAILDDLGPAAAIEWQAREFERRTEIECRLTHLEEEVPMSPERATAVFRIFQEVLTNVARHAGATLVEVSLRQLNGEVILKVRDNGRGIRESDLTAGGSLGLLGMRERAGAFGGSVRIEGEEGKGTTVTVSIPHE